MTIQETTSVPQSTTRPRSRTEWTLLSNHGYVLLCIADDADTRLRDIAMRVGITERAVFGIVERIADDRRASPNSLLVAHA